MKRSLTMLTVLIAAAAITTSLVSNKTQSNHTGSFGHLSNLILNFIVIHIDDEGDGATPADGNRMGKTENHVRSVGQIDHTNAIIAHGSEDEKEDNDGEEGKEDEGGKESEVTGPDRLWGVVKLG